MSLLTTIYKFIKPQLTDSPPDITVMNPNWDIIDAELNSHKEQINTLNFEVDAHLSSAKLKLISISRDLSLVGDQAIAGVGFKPSAIIALGVVSGQAGKFSIGLSDKTLNNNFSVFDYSSSVANAFASNNSLVEIQNTFQNGTKAVVKSFDADGLTLTWGKYGTGATGNVGIYLLCISH